MPILDGSVPTVADFEAMLDEAEHRSVYVHCAQGHGRTGLFAVALLMRRGAVASVDAGVALLKARRPELGLNARQTAFLRTWSSGYSR